VRAVVVGTVIGLDKRTWTGQDGKERVIHQAFIRSEGSDLRYGADLVEYDPAKVELTPGQIVSLVCSFQAKGGAKGPWIRVWAVEHYAPAEPLAAVS
jgi:hypothetical protein